MPASGLVVRFHLLVTLVIDLWISNRFSSELPSMTFLGGVVLDCGRGSLVGLAIGRQSAPDGSPAQRAQMAPRLGPRHQRYLEHSWRRLLQSGAALMPLLLCFQRCCRRRLLLQLGARGQQQSGTLSLSQGAIRPWAWPQQSLQSSSSSCGLLYLIKPDSLLSLPIFFVDCFRRKILTILDSIAASLFENNYLSWQIVSDDKIQVSLLILRRGALSTLFSFSIISKNHFTREEHLWFYWTIIIFGPRMLKFTEIQSGQMPFTHSPTLRCIGSGVGNQTNHWATNLRISPTNWSYQTLSESSFSLMSSGLCDVIWSTADKGAAVEPKDFSCVNRHLRNIKYAEGHSRVAIWKICMYIFMIWK